MPDRAQDTEAIRAALAYTRAHFFGEARGLQLCWEGEAALGRLVARLEAAEQARVEALGHVVAALDTMRDGASPALEAAHRILATGLTDDARAALAAAAPGETTSPSAPVAPRGWAGGRKADARHKTQEIGASAAPGETEQTP